jgi:hypothetical protein
VFPFNVADESVLGRLVVGMKGSAEAPALFPLGPGSSADLSSGGEDMIDGGGASGASYESTVMWVVAGLRGAPSGPINLTFFLSSPEGE